VKFFLRRLRPQFQDVIHTFSHAIESFEDNMPTLSRRSAEWLEGFRDPTSESLRLSQLALPHHQHKPTPASE
jgi:hypothetical protein